MITSLPLFSQDLKLQLDQKVDYRTFDLLKNSLATDFKLMEKKFARNTASPYATQRSKSNDGQIEKSANEIEKRLSAKMQKTFQRFGEIIKNQEKRIKGMIFSGTRGLSESRDSRAILGESQRRGSCSNHSRDSH